MKLEMTMNYQTISERTLDALLLRNNLFNNWINYSVFLHFLMLIRVFDPPTGCRIPYLGIFKEKYIIRFPKLQWCAGKGLNDCFPGKTKQKAPICSICWCPPWPISGSHWDGTERGFGQRQQTWFHRAGKLLPAHHWQVLI